MIEACRSHALVSKCARASGEKLHSTANRYKTPDSKRAHVKVIARMSRAGLFVVVNNAAARARAAWPRVRKALAREGIRFEAHESLRPGETEERTRAAIGEGFETIAVVGGDGTLSAATSGYFGQCKRLSKNEGLLEGKGLLEDDGLSDNEGLSDSDRPLDDDGLSDGEGLSEGKLPRAVNSSAALALLPAGTGDDFARGLAGGRRESLEAWLARLIEHCRRDVNNPSGVTNPSDMTNSSGVTNLSVGSAEGLHRSVVMTRGVDVLMGSVDGGARQFVCLNAATLGIGAEVAARVAAQGTTVRRLPGEARFALAAVQSLAAWRNRRVRVRVDGREWAECETNLLAIVNGTYAGGGMNFSPEASLTDGLLDVLTVCGISRAGLVRELARVHRGGHLANPKVTLTRGLHVRVETLDGAESLGVEADGDLRGRTPAEFRVLPAALRVVF
jgi:diacylglycerol kinase family enzyme